MNTAAAMNPTEWLDTNDEYLHTIVQWIRVRLQLTIAVKSVESADSGPVSTDSLQLQEREIIARISELEESVRPPALVLLARSLGLSTFETQVLTLCIAAELDASIRPLCGAAQGNSRLSYASFGLAFMLFERPDWHALSPTSALRHFCLLDIVKQSPGPMTEAHLSLDERILNYLKGLNYLDRRLTPCLFSGNSRRRAGQLCDSQIVASHQMIVEQIVKHLRACRESGIAPVIELSGDDFDSKYLILDGLAQAVAINTRCIDVKSVPAPAEEFDKFMRLWQREAKLMPLVVILDNQHEFQNGNYIIDRFIDRYDGITFFLSTAADTHSIASTLCIAVAKPTRDEQAELWQKLLNDSESGLSQKIVQQFSFSQLRIHRLAHAEQDIWQACKAAARGEMDKLAQRIEVKAQWHQLVLPEDEKQLLAQIINQVANRATVYESWGYSAALNRGLGISALFSGESGTGKSMAAEVIADALNLDLYRIDLSAVVSKYIGETEKNLRKLFDAAEASGAILFFDEADALFGKRSEVKDSHDRYANIEINYLLQRMESYRGLAVLATNMKAALDKAFLRRLRFVVDFPLPAFDQRLEIWKRVFPDNLPLAEDIDFHRLARLNLSGGNIQCIALNAAFLAAQQNGKLTMPLALTAARSEFQKLERPTKASDFCWTAGLEVTA